MGRQQQYNYSLVLCMQVTYQRLQSALRALGGGSGGDQLRPGTALAEVVFSGLQPRFQQSPPAWKPLNTSAGDIVPATTLMCLPHCKRKVHAAASVCFCVRL